MNTINNNIIQSIFSFNHLNLENDSLEQIINKGLNIYSELTNCDNASLFLVDNTSFEFNFYSSTSFESVREITSLFDKFTDDGTISEVIINSEPVFREVEINSHLQLFHIIPLNLPNSLIGIIMLRNASSINADESIKFYLKGFSINYALIIERSFHTNNNLNKERNLHSPLHDIVGINLTLLKSLFDSLQCGVLIVDKSTSKIILSNSTAMKLIELDEAEIINNTMNSFFLIHSSTQNSKDGTNGYETLIHRANGTLLPVLMTESHLANKDDRFIVFSFLDISAKKKSEDELQKAHFLLEQRIELRTEQLIGNNATLISEIRNRQKAEEQLLKFMWAVEQSPTAILVLEIDGKIQYANKKYFELTGYTTDEVIGLKPKFIDSDKLDLDESMILDKVKQSSQLWKSELKNRKKNGEEFWTSLYITPITNLNGEITNFLCVQEDITEKKKVMEELVLEKINAEQSNNLKTYLLANMSHEFRTPLIGILGFTQILSTEITDEENSSMVDFIHQSGERLLKTLDGMLQLSDLETQKLLNKPVKIDFEQIVNSLADKYLDQIQEKGLDFKLDLIFEQIYFYSDPQFLELCLTNLLDNALKFTNSGSITISAHIINAKENKFVQIKIADTGIGIAEEKTEYIFKAFSQVDEGMSRSYDGVGLGLTIAKRIIELLEGEISVKSRLSEGSEFIIKLPLIPSAFRDKLVLFN
ncbi:MAG: PAS domain S-box protein [Ignavibacteriaceae bacterium]|nr:PAS domain S-box protein [Ignavibacteriaceae bacterium]